MYWMNYFTTRPWKRSFKPWPIYSQGKSLVHIRQEAVWVSEPVWTLERKRYIFCSCWESNSSGLARRPPLYRLSSNSITPHFATEQLAIQSRICEVKIQITAHKQAILNYIIRVFLSYPRQKPRWGLKINYNRFLPHPLQFIIHSSSYNWTIYRLKYWERRQTKTSR
jgi:hypothetical protein